MRKNGFQWYFEQSTVHLQMRAQREQRSKGAMEEEVDSADLLDFMIGGREPSCHVRCRRGAFRDSSYANKRVVEVE